MSTKKYLYHIDQKPKCFDSSEFEFAKKNGYMTVQEYREIKNKEDEVHCKKIKKLLKKDSLIEK